jgi:hypothetical protein
MRSQAVKYDFQKGFDTEEEANDYAEDYAWRWIDENGFEWSLEVEEYEEDDKYGPPQITGIANLIIPVPQWAKTFLGVKEFSDEQALIFLDETMENHFGAEQRLEYVAIRRLVGSLLQLNRLIIAMEIGEIPVNIVIEDAYRALFSELVEVAEKSSAIV